MSIGDRIKQVRLSVGLSQEKFGEIIKVSGAAVSRLESGNNNASEQTRSLICSNFNIREEWLRTGEGDMLVSRSREEELAAFMAGILDDGSNFKKAFISVLSRMTEDEWEVLEKKIDELIKERQKREEPPRE